MKPDELVSGKLAREEFQNLNFKTTIRSLLTLSVHLF